MPFACWHKRVYLWLGVFYKYQFWQGFLHSTILIHYTAAENSQSEDKERHDGNAQAQDYPAQGEGGGIDRQQDVLRSAPKGGRYACSSSEEGYYSEHP